MADIEKRYQVFVSSTFEDLQEERQEVMRALLELDCIPAGMELFPAANEEQWELIKQVIVDCDYYVLIIGGRYGSIGPSGQSYTEMEYRYALEIGKPVIGFVHNDSGSLPAKRTEQSAEGRQKLSKFIELVRSKMCKPWTSPEDLGSVVSRSIVKLIKSHPAAGWVKADKALSQEASIEILRLKNRIEELESELQKARIGPPVGTEELSKGENAIEVPVRLALYVGDSSYNTENMWESMTTNWDAIFGSISPSMIDEASETEVRNAIDTFAAKETYSGFSKMEKYKNRRFKAITVGNEIFETILVQFNALGLIQKSNRKRSLKNTRTYWCLTPYGETVMTRLRAIKR